MDSEEFTPEERDAREERLFQLSEALQASFEGGQTHADSVWALRYDLQEADVARVRRGLELLFFDDDDVDVHDFMGALESLPPPELPADYEMRGELGRGGMGVVYRVHQVSLNRELALKVLRPGEMQARRAIERFKREARSLARLRHPHIASLHEVGECEGRVYFTMDLIEGQSLGALLKVGSVTPSRASRWARQLASALQYVHSHGLVHRDIKPANILIDEEDNACLVDFGLARDVEGSSDLTLSGHFLGTPAYMAPEQVRGQQDAVGESADIYAIGTVLYECLTGQRAFSGKTLVEVIHAVAEGKLMPPSELDGKIPTALELICLQAMSRDPADRYSTARALLEDLERFEAGRLVLARPPSAFHRARDIWQRNLPSMRVAIGTAIAMVVTFGLLMLGPLGGLSFKFELVDEALEFAKTGQSAAAVSLFERYYPSAPEGEVVTSWGLDYCDALLDLCEAANQEGREEVLRERSQEVLALVDQSLARLDRERTYRSSPLEKLRLEWGHRGLLAAAYKKDQELLRARLFSWKRDRQSYERMVGGVLPGGPIWEGSVHQETLLATSFLPDLLDDSRAGHGLAVEHWVKALRVGRESGLRMSTPSALMKRHRDSLPRILMALFGAQTTPELQSELTARAALRGSESQHWIEAVGAADSIQLREGLVALLRSWSGSEEELQRIKSFCRAVLELPDLPSKVDDREWLAALLDPDLYDPRADLVRRAEYLGQVLVQSDELSWAPIYDWVEEVTEQPFELREAGKGVALESAREFAGRLRAHCAAAREALDAEAGRSDPLAGFDQAKSTRTRRLRHEGLKFALRAPALPPIWSEPEPQQFGNRWHALLDPNSIQQKHTVHLAGLRFGFGAFDPELRFTSHLTAVPGEAWRVEIPIPTPGFVQQVGDGVLGSMGLESQESSGVLQIEGQLNYERGGLRVEWEIPREVRGIQAEVRAAGSGRNRCAPGSVEGLARVDFYRGGAKGAPGQRVRLAEEFVMIAVQEHGAPEIHMDVAGWWGGSGLKLGGPAREWLATQDPIERERLAKARGIATLDGDLHERLLTTALQQGVVLSPAEHRTMERLAAASRRRGLKGGVLWTLAVLLGLVVLGFLVAIVIDVGSKSQRAKRMVQREATTQSELEAMGPSLLVTTLMIVWWPGAIPLWGFGPRMLIYSLLAWNACRHQRSQWKWVPSGAGALAGLAFLVQHWLGNEVLQTASAYTLPFALYLVSLFALPVVFDGYWSWHPDPKKGARLRKVANFVFVTGFVVPMCTMVFMGKDVQNLLILSWSSNSLTIVLLHLVTFFGLEFWLIALLRTTARRSAEIMKQGMQRRKEALRAQKALG